MTKVFSRTRATAGSYLAALLVFISAGELSANPLLAHWLFHEAVPSFADQSRTDAWLLHDVETTAPARGPGVRGSAAGLRFQPVPGVSTRLFAPAPALQNSRFGFSLWIRPSQINAGDNLIAKEMNFDNSTPNYARLAWQVSVLGDAGSGLAPVELVVRGDNRAAGDFFGSAVSAPAMPLLTDAADWVHIAGGYDSLTGALTLYVNGAKTTSANSSPGATLTDGGPIVIGSARNGSDFVAFAGTAFVDDVQLYGEPLADGDVAWLRARPGQALPQDVHMTDVSVNTGAGEHVVHFETTGDARYTVEASTDLHDFSPVALHAGGIPLRHDSATAGAWVVPGVEGDAARLRWEAGSTTTRLFADSGALQTDSFGFSFWIRPIHLNPFDNLLAKEMPYDGAAPLFSRMAWQVHLLENNGSDAAHVQLIVRGANRSNGDFFGTAISTHTVPLFGPSREWIHVAGGYSAHTGDLRLYVNGVETVSGNSQPGAHHADGSALSIGSVRNGPDFVAFAGDMLIDDVRLFKEPPAPADVARLTARRGQTHDGSPHLTAHWLLNGPVSGYRDAGPSVHLARIALSENLPGFPSGAARFFRVVRNQIPASLTECE